MFCLSGPLWQPLKNTTAIINDNCCADTGIDSLPLTTRLSFSRSYQLILSFQLLSLFRLHSCPLMDTQNAATTQKRTVSWKHGIGTQSHKFTPNSCANICSPYLSNHYAVNLNQDIFSGSVR